MSYSVDPERGREVEVWASGVRVRVLGTVFTVADGEAVTVSVYRGVVAVTGVRGTRLLREGDSVRFPAVHRSPDVGLDGDRGEDDRGEDDRGEDDREADQRRPPGLGASGDAAPFVRGDKLYLTGSDRIAMVQESDFAPIVEVPGTFSGAFPTEDELLWVEGSRSMGATSEAFVGLIDPFATGGPATVDEVTIATFPLLVTLERSGLIAEDDLLVHSFTKRIFRFDGVDLVEIRSPALGSLARIAGRGDDVVARSRWSAHRIDASGPEAPVFVAGGPHGVDPAITLESAVPKALWDGRDPSFLVPPHLEELSSHLGARVEIRARDFDSDEPPVELSVFELDGNALVQVAGSSLYRSTSTSAVEAEARLERYDLQPLEVGEEIAPIGVWDIVPQESMPHGDASELHTLAVDPLGRRAAVALSAYRGLNDQEAALFVVDLVTGEVEEIAPGLDRAVGTILIAGDHRATQL